MKIINTEEYNELIKNGTVLVDFFAEWCGPCKMLGPVLEEVSGEYPDIEFVKVNVDENMDLAESLGIMSIPTVYLFRDGAVAARMNGYRDKGGVKAFIEDSLK